MSDIETEFRNLIKKLGEEKRLGDKRAKQLYDLIEAADHEHVQADITDFVDGIIQDISNPTRELKVKYGSYTTTSFGTGTNTKDTGESCGTIAFGGLFQIWPTTHWTFKLRGWSVSNSSNQIRVNINIENDGADQTYDIGWFAVYY